MSTIARIEQRIAQMLQQGEDNMKYLLFLMLLLPIGAVADGSPPAANQDAPPGGTETSPN